MGRGPFTADKVKCCPFCGNKKVRDYRNRQFEGSGEFSVTTQGRGSGDHDIVCDACGFDGAVRTVGQAKLANDGWPKRPKFCPMCADELVWTTGAPWAAVCKCGWMGDISIFDDAHREAEQPN